MKRFVIFIFFAIAILTVSPALAGGKPTLAERYAALTALYGDCSLADAETRAAIAAGLPEATIFHKKAKGDVWHIWFSDVGEHKITVEGDGVVCTVVPPVDTSSVMSVDAAIAAALVLAGGTGKLVESAKLRDEGGTLVYNVKILALVSTAAQEFKFKLDAATLAVIP